MKFILNFIFFAFASLNANTYENSPSPVSYVDPQKFSGVWHEIARSYNSFQKDCVTSTVEYKLVESFTYDITNSCFEDTAKEKLVTYNGKGEAKNGASMSEIRTTYYFFFQSDYKIIHLDNYENFVMSNEDMQNVWIMSREPFMEKDKLDALIAMLSVYMDTSKLIIAPHDMKKIGNN